MRFEEALPLMREGILVKRPNMHYAIAVKNGLIMEYRVSKIDENVGYWDERTALTSLQVLADDWEFVEEEKDD